MRKFSKKLATLSLLGLLGLSTFGCGSKKSQTQELTVTPFNYESEFEEDLITNNVFYDESLSEETAEPGLDVSIIEVDVVVANTKTAIYGPLDEKKIIGYLPEGKSLELISTNDDGYTRVDYYGKEAYVKTSDVSFKMVYDIKDEINKILYAKEDVSMVIPEDLSESGVQETVTIPKLECFEVYAEDEALYLAKTEDYIGYIAKENVEELNGTLIVIDISEQKLTLYKDNEIIHECPVITGTPTPDRQTDEGLWEIYDVTGARYLIGSNYKTPVDIMMKFHGNQGLHDASYHTCEFWQKKGRNRHGWREDWKFGGDTYILDGSHGCCNMMRDDVFLVYEYVTVKTEDTPGTPVLVKK